MMPLNAVAVPLIAVLSISIGLGAGSYLIARRARVLGGVLAGIAVAVLIANAVWLQNSVFPAMIVPTRNAVVYGNPMLPAVAILAGAVVALFKGPEWQRYLCLGAIAGVAGYRVIGPFVRPEPSLSAARWTNDVCRQSTLSTCSAAAGASALRAVGIECSECDMVDRCCSTIDGTATLGLYRGLRLSADPVGVRVEAIRESAVNIRSRLRGPTVFSIVSPDDALLTPSGRHSVVLFKFNEDGSADVGDPFSGRQRWSRKVFDRLWSGEGFMLIR